MVGRDVIHCGLNACLNVSYSAKHLLVYESDVSNIVSISLELNIDRNTRRREIKLMHIHEVACRSRVRPCCQYFHNKPILGLCTILSCRALTYSTESESQSSAVCMFRQILRTFGAYIRCRPTGKWATQHCINFYLHYRLQWRLCARSPPYCPLFSNLWQFISLILPKVGINDYKVTSVCSVQSRRRLLIKLRQCATLLVCM